MNKHLHRLLQNDLLANSAGLLFRVYRRTRLLFTDFHYDEAKDPSLTEEELQDYNLHRKFATGKVLCYAPKKSMLFSFDGNVYLCCENKADSIGHILHDRLHDIWFGEKRHTLDIEINQNYNLGGGCKNCGYKIHHKNYSTVQAQNFDLYTSNRSEYPARLEFEIHNTCNLECVMCSAIYSSSIQANRYHLPATPIVYGKDFLEQLEEFYPHLNSINLLGGEPTLIQPYHTIIERIQAVNPRCFIHLQTNAGTLNSKFRKLLENPAANFEIGISMDALDKELAEQIRVNLDFDKFMEHVRYYTELYRRGQVKLTINTCPMPINWQQLIPIIRFCNTNRLPVFFCIVNAPFYFSFLSTSDAFISKVHTELTEGLQQLPQNTYYEKNNHRQLQDYLNMLESWIPLIREYGRNREARLGSDPETLLLEFEARLNSLMIFERKAGLILEILGHIRATFEPLEPAIQQELLITLLNVTRDPILVTSEQEHMRWAREYINTLVFSYQQRSEFS